MKNPVEMFLKIYLLLVIISSGVNIFMQIIAFP
jgi:hypothetical protein